SGITFLISSIDGSVRILKETGSPFLTSRTFNIEIIFEIFWRKSYSLKSTLPIVFEGGSDWDYTIISPVASQLCNYFKKPTFIFKKLKHESQGTVRSTHNIDSVALMENCKEYVITYGGHAQASGFRVKNENLEKFKNCLIKNTSNL
ncbi:MAG TPA: hypothetical protein ENH90_02090, partial [bacterium]|nr:hypothetical protein [bacterium]